MNVPIVMCNWKRTDNIPRTLAMLEGQTRHDFNLYIWNNNSDDAQKLDQIVSMYKLSYDIEVHHSRENVGGIGRFYFAKDISKDYDGPVTAPGENVDYCGTGGMLSPISVFKKNELFEMLPERYKFIEDLWLSYFFRYEFGGNLVRSNNDFILETDAFDQGKQGSPLRPLKDELLEFCKDKWIRKANKKLNDMFNKTYVINMKNRPDRMQRSTSRLKDIGLDFERFEAVNGHNEERHSSLLPGEVGCYKSHFDILNNAFDNKYESILILEDDVVFVDNFSDKFFEGYKYIPDDWEMIYLGCNHKKPYTRINDYVVKCNFAYTTSAIIIKGSALEKLLRATKHMHRQIDVVYAEMQAAGQLNAYAYHPWLMYQEDGWSDIQGRHVNYGMMRK